ncbi:MAG TPA: depupylase/deamidase Dop [Acidimicrobiales bacterium]|jgi:proteasome accessory factor A|nr:depupylase/deamidase Dop [Acidimicrobiales bacterium]
MGIAKILGIETEFGVQPAGPDPDPIGASSALVNAYATSVSQRTAWDFEDESPGLDARGMPTVSGMAPMVETHLANTVLTNGARFYVDHAHPEYSSPECRTPTEAVRYDVAGEHVLRAAMRAAKERGMGLGEIVVYKNNSDGKGNSYGCHENFLVDRDVAFGDVVRAMVPHLVTRIIYTGSGKVGAETPSTRSRGVEFQISQRAEFMEEIVGLETTLKRPIVNTRDEPHGDPRRYRRLHIIVGDANMSQVATFLKLGTTALLLGALEDVGIAAFPESPQDPVRTIHELSCDLDLSTKFELAGGGRSSALELQTELYELAERYVRAGGAECVGGDDEANAILARWSHALVMLRSDPVALASSVDWIAKRRLVEGYRARHDTTATDPRLLALDLQYHDLRSERSLAQRAGLEVLVDPASAERAVTEPPLDTRAFFRGTCLRKYPTEIVTANWDSLVFDLGTDPLRRVPMMDPLRGTAAHTEALLARCDTAAQLLDELGS